MGSGVQIRGLQVYYYMLAASVFVALHSKEARNTTFFLAKKTEMLPRP